MVPSKLTALVSSLVVLCTPASGQVSGYYYRGNGIPASTTYIQAPPGSPFASPATAPDTAPTLQPSPVLETTTAEALARGQCYCTPASDGWMDCYHLVTASPEANTTAVDCDPPLDYTCKSVIVAAGVYAQESGSVFKCNTLSPSPASGLPTPSTPAEAPVNHQNYSLVFQPNSSSPAESPLSDVRFAKTPLLEAAQLVDVNPRPVSSGLQFAGVDITVNGELNGIPLEPPNPALCVGNGFLLEATNDVLVVYSAENGSVLAGPTDYQHFFGVEGPPLNGLSDSYCLYDAADSKRFFVSMSYFSCRTAACLAKGPVPVFSYLLLGVSKTSDPRDGFLGPYFVATNGIDPDTNQPYPGFGDCGTSPPGFTGKGCLGDFPNPGMDRWGFWFGMNMFTIDANTLVGANVFGVRKADLLSGEFSNPSVVTYTDWAPYPGFTIVPSITQATSQHSAAQGGAIFLMSSDSFTYTAQSNDSLGIPSIRSWAITNTSLLHQNFPDGHTPLLSPPVTLQTQPLQFATAALADPTALSGASLQQPNGPRLGAQDERMRQVSFSGGFLYSCLNTPVSVSRRTFDGLAYFVLRPNFTAEGRYTASIADQGYVAVDGSHLVNGALTSATNGSMVIAGSIVGRGMFLSAFYAHITPQYGPGPVHVPRPARQPLLNEGPGQLPQRRTGDYSSALLDEQGSVWLVAEWASDRFTYLQQPDSKNPRLANWGTYIFQVNPYTLD